MPRLNTFLIMKAKFKTVKVIFKNPKYNYTALVNPNMKNKDLRTYFVNSQFDLGTYPKENLQTCINIKISYLY
jgi:hypothetical protein